MVNIHDAHVSLLDKILISAYSYFLILSPVIFFFLQNLVKSSLFYSFIIIFNAVLSTLLYALFTPALTGEYVLKKGPT